MQNLTVIKNLLFWMEKFLNQKSHFSVSEIADFFASAFVIKTNNRIIQATPTEYHAYLYRLKSTLEKVRYDVDEVFECENSVVATFTIHLDFSDKKPQSLITVSIFKFNKDHRIIEWKEIFADAYQKTFSYDF